MDSLQIIYKYIDYRIQKTYRVSYIYIVYGSVYYIPVTTHSVTPPDTLQPHSVPLPEVSLLLLVPPCLRTPLSGFSSGSFAGRKQPFGIRIPDREVGTYAC